MLECCECFARTQVIIESGIQSHADGVFTCVHACVGWGRSSISVQGVFQHYADQCGPSASDADPYITMDLMSKLATDFSIVPQLCTQAVFRVSVWACLLGPSWLVGVVCMWSLVT
jgi:hypothetical protein